MRPINTDSVKTAVISFADLVREKREAKGISREELAAYSGITYITIRNVENHKYPPTFETMLRLSASLNINPKKFVELTKA